MERTLAIGEQFEMFEELEEAVKAYENEKYVQLYVRHSRSTTKCQVRITKKTLNPRLKYGELLYACIHGGKKFVSRSDGHRPNQS